MVAQRDLVGSVGKRLVMVTVAGTLSDGQIRQIRSFNRTIDLRPPQIVNDTTDKGLFIFMFLP